MTPSGESAFRPERVSRPREQVESQIRAAILSGAFRKGDRLPSEAELAKEFAVSRSTIREALRSLSSSGLISTSPGASGGSFVEGVDHRTLGARFGEGVQNILRLGSLSYGEVAALRVMLEIPSARLAALNRRDEHLERLHDILEQEKSISVDDPAVSGLNAAFHETVADASGNRLLAALVSALHQVARPLGYIETSPDLGRESVIHHLRIVGAIRDRDAVMAQTAMEAHLQYLSEHVADDGRSGSD